MIGPKRYDGFEIRLKLSPKEVQTDREFWSRERRRMARKLCFWLYKVLIRMSCRKRQRFPPLSLQAFAPLRSFTNFALYPSEWLQKNLPARVMIPLVAPLLQPLRRIVLARTKVCLHLMNPVVLHADAL